MPRLRSRNVRFRTAVRPAILKSDGTATTNRARNLLTGTDERFRCRRGTPRGLCLRFQQRPAGDGYSTESKQPLQQFAPVGARSKRFGERIEPSIIHSRHSHVRATTKNRGEKPPPGRVVERAEVLRSPLFILPNDAELSISEPGQRSPQAETVLPAACCLLPAACCLLAEAIPTRSWTAAYWKCRTPRG